jgi:rubrerythrin
MAAPTDFFSAATALGTLTELDVAGMRLLFRVERSGEDFYNLLADRIGDREAAELLRRNGREERGHAERIRRALAIKLGGTFEPTDDDLAHFAIALPDEIPSELFPVVVRAELDGDAGYQRWADREVDPEVQRLLRQNGREETVHGERVRRVIEILARGAAR